jgi:phytoene dehydrogenase-like protein
MRASGKACVVGAGPNGLAAAIVVAQAGMTVDVFEAERQAGGAARTMELTLPGYRHDFGSAVHPLAVGSPFFTSLPLGEHGLQWVHSPAPLAHPLDDGTAVLLERDFAENEDALGNDGAAWTSLVRPFAERWTDFACDVLRPQPAIPRHPWLMARFGLMAPLSARVLARRFTTSRARALFAGLAAHSFLSLDEPLGAAFGLVLAASAHAVGWPIPRGGAQSITDALVGVLVANGGRVHLDSRIVALETLSDYDVTLCDLTPRQLIDVGARTFSDGYLRSLRRFRYGAAAFKVDYSLSEPIPWTARACLRAATVHIGGSYEEIAASEAAMRRGEIAERPFVLLAQPSLFDGTRAPEGKHVAWAYCHVPNGSSVDVLENLESQIERFAPGFREVVLARRVSSPTVLEQMDANLVGGDIGGGALDLRQFLFRPTRRIYATSKENVFICSSSTPPGSGVHGMCGYHAALAALASSRMTRV